MRSFQSFLSGLKKLQLHWRGVNQCLKSSKHASASRITLDQQKKLRTIQMFRVLVRFLSLTGWLFSNTNDLYLFIDVQSSWKIFILSRMIFLEHERSSKLADQTLTRQFWSARRIYWRKFFSQIKTSADYPWWTTGKVERKRIRRKLASGKTFLRRL